MTTNADGGNMACETGWWCCISACSGKRGWTMRKGGLLQQEGSTWLLLRSPKSGGGTSSPLCCPTKCCCVPFIAVVRYFILPQSCTQSCPWVLECPTYPKVCVSHFRTRGHCHRCMRRRYNLSQPYCYRSGVIIRPAERGTSAATISQVPGGRGGNRTTRMIQTFWWYTNKQEDQ